MSKLNNPLPSFDKPPVVEVVVGINFSKELLIDEFDIVNIFNEMGGKDKFEYRRLPLDMPTTIGQQPFNINFSNMPQLPKYWLQNKENKNEIIQFQKDKFIYNWTKQNDQSAYIRYEKVIENFFNYYNKINQYIIKEKTEIIPSILELAYVNLIDIPDNYSEVFKDVSWNKDGKEILREPFTVNLNYNFIIEDLNKSFMSVVVASVQLAKDGRNMLKCDLSVRGTPKDKNNLVEWYDGARDAIVKGFAEITTDRMHKLWERKSS
ncbi:MAG: TIGR04255 family protein [Hydrotalea sp.]|nr:TIGR04255 family protein [Hydrotalea sp.]